MDDLLEWESRARVQAKVRELLRQGELAAATSLVEEYIARSGSEDLMEASEIAPSTAGLDWVGVCAESIEADFRLQSINETGCRRVDIELGNQPENRQNLYRHYYGPPRLREGGIPGRAERWLGAHHGLANDSMKVQGIDQLAAIQLRLWPLTPEARKFEERAKMLAGHLLVLRFFTAVQHHAASQGLPVPAEINVGVQRPLGGEDALTQVEPSLAMTVSCIHQPITTQVEQRLEARHQVHVAEWHEKTEKILHNLRVKYDADGYAPTYMIPDEVGKTKERLKSIEQRLLHFSPFYRLRKRGFAALLEEIRVARERTAPVPIITTPYR